MKDGIQVKSVAEGLDIHPFMLSRWRKEYREGKLQGDGQKRVSVTKEKRTPSAKALTENAQLKKENERLKQENELLKKWQRYLAERHQNDLDSSKDTENQAWRGFVAGWKYRQVVSMHGKSAKPLSVNAKTKCY